MKFNIVLNTPRKFPIIRLDDNTPCIVGDASLKVFLSAGGLTMIHSCKIPGKHLCEIHPHNFIGVRETVDETSYFRLFRIEAVDGSLVRYTIV